MKKLIALMLALLLTVSLAACGAPAETPDTTQTTSNPEATPTSAPPADTQPPTTEPQKEPEITYTPREFNKSATIEETVLVDENDIKITATKLTYGHYAAELTLVIENNSDKDLSFIANSLGYSCNSVNGYMIADGYLSCEVTAGKKADDTLSFRYSDLMLYGIFEIADMQIGFDIRDDDYKHFYTGPRTILTSAAASYDYETPCYRENIASKEAQAEFDYSVTYFCTDTIYEGSGLSVVSQAIMKSQHDEHILLLEVVNTTDEILNISTRDIDLNGLRICDSTWSQDTVNPGKTAIVDVNLSSVLEPEYWTAYGIDEIGKVALKLIFKDQDSKEFAEPAELTLEVSGDNASFSQEGTEIYNSNGVRLIFKGVYADPSEYSEDLHILLAAENTSGKKLTLDDEYDSLSINDYMASYSFSSATMEDGSWVMIDVVLWGSGLEDIQISKPSEVKSIEFSISIKDQKYNKIDEATIAFTVE